jgi:hypothetical protein
MTTQLIMSRSDLQDHGWTSRQICMSACVHLVIISEHINMFLGIIISEHMNMFLGIVSPTRGRLSCYTVSL